MRLLRLDAHRPRETARWTLGVLVSSDCQRVAGALVASSGRGVLLRPEIVDCSSVDVPPETQALFHELDGCARDGGAPGVTGRIASLRAQLAETEALVVREMTSRSGPAQTRLLAVAVHDPGVWGCGASVPGTYMSLCDAARLAELTDANVIDAFPARDVARGGQGGPIAALPEWILLGSSQTHRALVDLGSTVRLSFLPRVGGEKADARVLSFEVGPGMRLLDQLVQRLTQGEHRFDPGGRFAVQGRRIRALLEHWLADPWFRRPLPRWQPRGVRPERFLLDAVQMAVESGWSVRDLLCTATHLIAETVARSLERYRPPDMTTCEAVVTGGGQHNGLLLREIVDRVPGVRVVRVGQLGLPDEALAPACVALLALLYVDQVPANHPAVTGTELPRVLGRLTPGSPQSWQRLLLELTGTRPAVRPLRAAV
jgi:anhydro-N-acetylmuramic acid kinase